MANANYYNNEFRVRYNVRDIKPVEKYYEFYAKNLYDLIMEEDKNENKEV